MTTLEWAKFYNSKGFSVIPLKYKSKIPAIASWKEFQDRHATDEELNKWFGNGSNNNIAIVTGQISGIVVIDLDSQEAIQYAKDNDFPKTPLVKTGKGYHLYCQYRNGISNFQNRDDLPDIDLRAEGGYVVADPSIHPSGKQYQWVPGKGLDDLPLAELPEIILTKRPEHKKPLNELYKGVDKDNRNKTLTRLAGSWANDGLDFNECLESAFLWNQKNNPPLDEREVTRTVRSIFEKHQNNNISAPIVLSKFYPRPFTDQLLMKHKFIWEGKKGYLWWYDPDGGIMMPNGEDFIKKHFRTVTNAIDDTLKKKHVIDEIIEDVKGCAYSMSGLSEPILSLIPFNNGVYDLDADKFREFTPHDCFTWKLPWKYNPDAECNFLKNIINSMVPKVERITLWELMAYALYREYPFQKFFLLLGGGRNGKSTFMNIFTRLLGQENISNASLGDIQTNRFSAGSLFHKLANISGEVDYNDLEDTRLLKQLTGGDNIQADRKFMSPVNFLNYAKLIFLTNQVPKTKDTTEAFYRRVFLIEFPFQFSIDPSIPVKIHANTPEMTEEYEGLLYKVVRHLKILMEQNFIFTRGRDIDEIRDKYNHLSNPITQFLKEGCERTYDSKDFIYKIEFKKKLNDWLQQKKFNTYTDKKTGQAMKNDLGFEEGKADSPDRTTRWNAWIGIKWIDIKPASNANPVQDVKDVNLLHNHSLCSQETVVNTLDKLDMLDKSKSSKCVGIDNCNTNSHDMKFNPKTRSLKQWCKRTESFCEVINHIGESSNDEKNQ